MLQSINDLHGLPLLILVLSFLAMSLSGWIGLFFRKRKPNQGEDARQDLDVIVTATLTLLGLIIGFTFSMAISRYDQRKVLEEAEANAIGTEYVRADLLPAADAAKVRSLLRNYLNRRIEFYKTRDDSELRQIQNETAQLQTDLWSVVKAPDPAQAAPIFALVIAGMNDVLNSQGYTQAAWWNRIPVPAWGLMMIIAICANLMVAYSRRVARAGIIQILVLPLILSIAFSLIADIDNPRWGVIRVLPQNLISLSQSMRGQ